MKRWKTDKKKRRVQAKNVLKQFNNNIVVLQKKTIYEEKERSDALIWNRSSGME